MKSHTTINLIALNEIVTRKSLVAKLEIWRIWLEQI